MSETIAIFVQDSRTKENISLHTLTGCTVQEGGAVSKAFGQVPVKQQEGVCRVLHSYRCVYRIVNEVGVVGVVLGDECTTHETRLLVEHVVSLIKSLTSGKVTASNLKRRYGELFLSLEETIHQIGGVTIAKEATDILSERPLVASEASMKLLYQKSTNKQQLEQLTAGLQQAEKDALKIKTLEDVSFGFVSEGGGLDQTDCTMESKPIEFHPDDAEQQLQGSISEEILSSSLPMNSTPPPAATTSVDDAFSFMASPGTTTPSMKKDTDISEPVTRVALSSGSALDLNDLFGAADVSPKQPAGTTTVNLNDIISGKAPSETKPTAVELSRSASTSPPPVIPLQVKDYQLSIMIQETATGQLSSEESEWSVSGDLLVLGRGTLLSEKEIKDSNYISSPDVTKDTLFVKISGHVDIRPNPSLIVNQKTDKEITILEVIIYQKLGVIPSTRQSPIVLCKYRQKKKSQFDPPLMAKVNWESMCKPDQGESKVLDQVILMWAVNPSVTIQYLSLAVNSATPYCRPDKQQSKPKGEWDDNIRILAWSPIVNSETVLSSKLQARFQNVSNNPPVTSEQLQSHKSSRHPIQIKLSGTGLLGVAQVSFHPTSDCGTPAVLAGGLQTKFSSGKGLVVV